MSLPIEDLYGAVTAIISATPLVGVISQQLIVISAPPQRGFIQYRYLDLSPTLLYITVQNTVEKL